MNEAQIHLLLNHVPIMGSLIATAILAWGMIRKNEEIIRVSLYLLIGSALAALPVYFSGEGAEEAVEHLPGVVERLIEDHEHLAKVAIILMEGLGLGAAVALYFSFRKQVLPLAIAAGLLIVGLVNAGVLAQTAHLGGMIRHTEIRQATGHNTGTAQTDRGETSKGNKDNGSDD